MLPAVPNAASPSVPSTPRRRGRSWARRGSVAAAVTALSLAGASGVEAAPDAMTAAVLAESGEQAATGTGPVVAPVDPSHASHAAASAALAEHHAALAGDAMAPDGMAPGGMAPGGMAPDGMAPDGMAPGSMAHGTMPMHGAGPGTTADGAAPSTTPGTTAAAPVDAAGVAAAAATDPAQVGRWDTLAYDLPLRAVHVTALKNGTVLLIAGSGNKAGDNRVHNFSAYVWDPATGALTAKPVPYDAFCAFHVVDADGNVIVVGGTETYTTTTATGATVTPWKGSDQAYKYVVDTGTWEQLPPMSDGRWYAGAVMDGQERIFVYSGLDANGKTSHEAQVLDPTTGAWSPVPRQDLPMYPGLHGAADGRLLYSGAHYGGGLYSWVRPQLFDPLSGASTPLAGTADLTHRNAAMSAVVGSADQQLVWVAGGGFPAVKSSYFIDMDAAAPAVVPGPALATAKAYVSISDLPDLTALETGGGTAQRTPVYEASILDPARRTLRPVAPPRVGRTYHSSSLTLADGRVATFGGDPGGAANFVLKVEMYSPPYLFKGARPTVVAAPGEVAYGAPYAVAVAPGDAPLTSATLLRPGSATHSADSSQRALRLATRPIPGGLEVVLPTDRDVAVPGWYMLSVLDAAGRPSTSRWVHLG